MGSKLHRVVVDIPVESWLSIKDESKKTGLSVEEIWGQMFGFKRVKVEIVAKKWKWLLDE